MPSPIDSTNLGLQEAGNEKGSWVIHGGRKDENYKKGKKIIFLRNISKIYEYRERWSEKQG